MSIKFKNLFFNFNTTLCSLLILMSPTVAFSNEEAAKSQEHVTQALKFAASGDLNSLQNSFGRGLDINTKDPIFGATALHNAASQGHLHVVDWLLSAGADVSVQDTYGSTPLIWAAYQGQSKVVERLLSAQANINHINQAGATALVSGIQSGKMDVVKTLLNKGAQKDLHGVNGMSPVKAAKASNQLEILQLIQSGEQE
jgi:ankyrin repeat protein